MSRNSGNSSSGGIGFIGLLQILFIGLKLTNHIDWTWPWVLSPMIFATVVWIIAIFIVAYFTRD